MTSSYIANYGTPFLPSPWMEELLEIAKKYDNGRPFHYEANTIPLDFSNEVLTFTERFLTWLENEYAQECSTFVRTYKHWTGTLPYPAEKSFRSWFSDETSPSPHGGYPGAQWHFDTSPAGRVSKYLPQLRIAYQRCADIRQQRVDAEMAKQAKQDAAKARQQALLIAEEKDRQRIAKQLQERYEHYKQLLSDSLRMRHYASYVKNGEIYPESWEPGFSMEIRRQMMKELGGASVDKVISEFQRDPQMIQRIQQLHHEWLETKEREKKEEEERKAEILARAIVREQAQQHTTHVPSEQPKTLFQKLFNL